MEPIIDHIQITVKDMSVAVPFYDKLLPLLGFDIQQKGSAVIEEHEFHVVAVHPSAVDVCHHLTEKRFRGRHDQSQETRVTTSSCIQSGISRRSRQAAFRAEGDRGHDRESTKGASRIYAARYYALFFKDLEGIKVRDCVHQRGPAVVINADIAGLPLQFSRCVQRIGDGACSTDGP